MKEIDKKVLEAEIESKASSEVSDTEVGGVSGGFNPHLLMPGSEQLIIEARKKLDGCKAMVRK